jgi:Asp-tRNA(Asn)/Glu-tRNA(Gln) amidotransferase A subunit family amidase
MGFNSKELPISIQISSGHWREPDLLRVARAYEAATPEFMERRPPVG